MSKFSTSKYDRRMAVYAAVRRGAPALSDAVESGDALNEWDPNNLPDDVGQRGRASPFKGVAECERYLENYSAASLDALSSDRIAVGYSIFGDIKRQSMLGANTVGLDVEFDWTVGEVVVKTYNGVNRPAQPVIHATEVVATGGKERSGIQKATGWDRRECDTMSPEQVQSLVSLLGSAKAGFNKYTRLVKGMLIYLDLLHHGPQVVTKRTRTIPYRMGDVLASYQRRDRAYVFCSDGTSFEYMAVLMAIGEEYPNPDITSHCDAVVPADAKDVIVVVNGAVPSAEKFRITLTPQLVMASLMKYAEESWCSDELESALVCACSLYENRYLLRASLPRVVSAVDLILPAMLKPVDVRSARPHVTKEMVSTIGKVHQMSMFLTIKDVIMAAKVSTKPGFSYDAVVRQYLTSQEEVIGNMSGRATPLSMLDMTPQMLWMYVIDAEALAFLDSVSIFEALWLGDGGLMSIRDGGITVLKKGIHDMTGNNPYRDIVDQELRKTNIVFDFTKLPHGNFTIASRYIRDTVDYTVKIPEYETIEVEMVYPCDFDPGDKRMSYVKNRVLRLRSEGYKRRSSDVIEGERIALKKVESNRTTSGELSSILDSPPRSRMARNKLSRSRSRGHRKVESESRFWDGKSIRELKLTKRSASPSIAAIEGKAHKHVFSDEVRERLKNDIVWAQEQGPGVERKENIGQSDIEVTQIVHSNMVGMHKAEDDASVLRAYDIHPQTMIGGVEARAFVEKVRLRYSEEQLPPSEFGKLCYILKDVLTIIDIRMLDLDDILWVTRIRDSYARRYRAAESGRSRHFAEAEGKVVSLEVNVRRNRRQKGDDNGPTGITDNSRMRNLMNEFYLSEYEIKLMKGYNNVERVQ